MTPPKSPLRRVLSAANDFRILLTCWPSPTYWETLKRIRTYRNRHRGRRCFILGNGPSLGRMDLSPLEREITFGLNRIYLHFEKMGFATTYLVSVNPYVLEQSSGDIARVACPKFISWNARRQMHFGPDIVYLRSRSGPRFCTDLAAEGVWNGATVTYVALQLAYYMGFRRVILIGVDHSFQTRGRPHAVVTSEGDDPNHFAPNYFGKGFRWQLPDLETSEIAFGLARERFEADGREVVDATVGGKLQVFKKASYEELVGGR